MSDPEPLVNIEIREDGLVFVTVGGHRKGTIKSLLFHATTESTPYPSLEVNFEIPRDLSEDLKKDIRENAKGWPSWAAVRVIEET